MRTFLGVLLLGVLSSGCQKETPAEVHVDNTATRYTEGLITATEKAKISAEKSQPGDQHLKRPPNKWPRKFNNLCGFCM